jgi:hypothetical protein
MSAFVRMPPLITRRRTGPTWEATQYYLTAATMNYALMGVFRPAISGRSRMFSALA